MGTSADRMGAGQGRVVVDHPAQLCAYGNAFVIALGTFDGVHRGHQAILTALADMGRTLSATPVVLFFEPHPRMVLHPESAPLRLCGVEEKMSLMSQGGIGHFVCLPFTEELSRMSPEAFHREYLSRQGIDIRGFCVGENWRFGCRNSGDGHTLAALSGKPVSIVPSVMLGDVVISSTCVRNAIESGDMALASAMLGRPVTLSGDVCHGQHVGGAVLSCPTANVDGAGRQLPKFGVYAARGHLAWGVLDGIVYVGDAPTLRGEGIVVELHLFDFTGDLYGQHIEIEFVKYLRGSVRFADSDALRRQIGVDIENAKRVLKQ